MAVILNEVKDLEVEESSNQKQILRPRNRPQDDKQGQAIAALRRNDKEGVIPSGGFVILSEYFCHPERSEGSRT